MEPNTYEVIIIGGSYAGLSAAMSLGRALRKTLVIDAGAPCNQQTPHSHNFLTNDGKTPAAITHEAKAQVSKYLTVSFVNGFAKSASRADDLFTVTMDNGLHFKAKRLILATGIKDHMPDIKGFAACWGISAIHCPYCHGYEYAGAATGILANGEGAMHYAELVYNLTKDLTIFTNGKADFTSEQLAKLERRHIQIITTPINEITHEDGHLTALNFNDDATFAISAIYYSASFTQTSNIAEELGCEFDEKGLIIVDKYQKTNVNGVLACGDTATLGRSVPSAVAAGNLAGIMLNNELAATEFGLA